MEKVLKGAKEYTLMMEYLIELHGNTADGFIIAHISDMEDNNPKVYEITRKQAEEWANSNKPKISPEVKEAMEKRAQWLIIEKGGGN